MWFCLKEDNSMEKHYDPVIASSLLVFARKEEWRQMRDYLGGLSNSGFRVASYVLAERVLTTLDNAAYWQCFAGIAQTDTKAYLKTFLKAAVASYKKGIVSFDSPNFLSFANSCRRSETSIDRQKTLQMLLPQLSTYEEAECVLEAFCGDDTNLKLRYLTASAESSVCYFALFRLMKQSDLPAGRTEECLKCILKRGTPTAYNFVSVMKEYFGLDGEHGGFSLRVRPYELSRIENNYSNFVEIITCI